MADRSVQEIAEGLSVTQRDMLIDAGARGQLYLTGGRGGAAYRALARRHLTCERANFVLTELGRKVAKHLAKKAAGQ